MKYTTAVYIGKATDLREYKHGQWVKRGNAKGVYVTTKPNGESVIIWHGDPTESVIDKLIKFVKGE